MRSTIFFILLAIFISIFCTCSVDQSKDEASEIRGVYLGQTPPGLKPELFAPGIVSSGMEELNLVFFPEGDELIYSLSFGQMRWALVSMKMSNGIWSDPEVLPFSGLFSDVDACVSPDGSRIWFSSNRPLSGNDVPKEDFDIWYVDRTENGWGEPVNPGAPINSDTHEFFPCVVNSGTIYFQSRREGGAGLADIFYCTLINGEYQESVPLPAPINDSGFQGDTFVAPDESYAIVSTTPAGAPGWADLYISFKGEDGKWGDLINMGTEINSPTSENTPTVTWDGKYLFYKSRLREDYELGNESLKFDQIKEINQRPQNGNGDIYWVDAQILQTSGVF